MAKKNGKAHSAKQWQAALGEVIGRLRAKNGSSQTELAKKLGTEGTYFSRIENGHVLPRIDKLERLGSLFHLSASQLLARVEKAL